MATSDAGKLIAPAVGPALGKVFGEKGELVGAIIADAFNAPNFVDIRSEACFTYKLAPSYGKLNSQSIIAMDEQLKVAIVATVRALGEAADGGNLATWDELLAIIMQQNVLEPHPDQPVHVKDSYLRQSTDVFKVDGSPDESTVKAINIWFRRAVGDDEDVLDATSIDETKVKQLAEIVAATGIYVGAGPVFRTFERVERTLLDVGVLRFPDIENPFFKVYRLQLHAWRKCERMLMVEDNTNGLDVQFSCRKYVPRESVLKGMKEEVFKKACAEADDLFA